MRRVLSTIAWQCRVIAHLARSQPLATLSSVGLGLVADVAQVLAFILPLKVILLAGSDGVPKYFRPFVDPEDKSLAIVVLALGAALCYVLSIWLEIVVRKLSASGSQRVLENANSVSIVNNQGDETSDIFLRFVELASGALFVAVVMAVLAWLNPLLFGCLSVGIAGSFLYLARGAEDPADRPSRRGIVSKLSVLSALMFFAGFVIVLMPFVLSMPGRNILVAFVSFILLRRTLSVLPKLVRQSIKLAMQRPLISALVFPHHQLPRHDTGAALTFAETFARPTRMARVRSELVRAGLVAEGEDLDVAWVDPDSRDFQTFEVRASRPGESVARLYLLRVLSPGREFLAENERFLFERLSPEALAAPPLVARYNEGSFDCLVSKIGAAGVETELGKDAVDSLLERHWSIDPGAELAKAYRTSHQFLHERLTEKLVSRAGVAVDLGDEAETLEAFRGSLSRLRRELRAAPLYVFNPHLDVPHLYRRADSEVLASSWGRWSLEPVGAVLPADDSDAALAERLARVREARPSLPEGFSVAHLRLAADAFLLEQQLGKGLLKRALSTMADLLASPLVADRPASTAERAFRRTERKPVRAPRDPARRGRRDGALPLAVEGESLER